MTDIESILCVGFDVGGTKTNIVYRFKGAEPDSSVRFSSHGANFHSSGASQIMGLVAASLSRIREEVESDVIMYAVAGIAGAGRKETRDALNQEFSVVQIHQLDRFEARSDAYIAVEGAFSGGSGTIIIAGTGSGVYAKSASGDLVRAGGWGSRLGDSGSGEQMGRLASRAIMGALDGGKETSLLEMLSIELGITDRDRMIAAVYDENLKFSTLAPFVLEAAENGDEVASEILRSELHDLAQDANLVLEQVNTSKVALIGGLCQNAFYRALLEEALTAEIPHIEITDPDHSPEIGALILAEALSGTGD